MRFSVLSLFSSPGVYACGTKAIIDILFFFCPPSGGEDWFTAMIGSERTVRAPEGD